MLTRIGDFIERGYHWPGAPAMPAVVAAPVSPATLAAAMGLYDDGGGGFLTLVACGGRLCTSVGGAPDEEYDSLADGRFASTDRDVGLAVVRDGAGQVVALARTVGAATRTFPRLGPLARGATGALDAAAAARGDSVLGAAAAGSPRTAPSVTPGMRSAFGDRVWPAVQGLRDATAVGAAAVTGSDVVRRSRRLARLGYFRSRTDAGARLVVVYYTADGLVTDVDAGDE